MGEREWSGAGDTELVAYAKLILENHYNMTEAEAHRFIGKSAMDNCVRRRVIAERIIAAYEKQRRTDK